MIAHFWLIFPPRNVLFAYGLSYARKRLSVSAFIFGLLFFSYDVIQICTFSNSMLSTKKCTLQIGYYMKCTLFIFLFVWAFSGPNATIRLLEIPKTFCGATVPNIYSYQHPVQVFDQVRQEL